MPKGYFTQDGIDYNEIWNNQLLPGIDRYNEVDKTDLEALFATWTDEQIFSYMVRSGNTFQKLGTIERPDRGLPAAKGKFQGVTEKFGTGFSFDENYLKDAKASTITEYQADILEQDRMNIRSILLSVALLSSTDGFYNGSFESTEGITAPPKFGTITHAAGHTHYITAGKTYLDLDFCADLREHYVHHGYGMASAVGLINPTDEKAVTKLVLPTATGIKVSNPITDQVAVNGYITRAGGIDWLETAAVPAGYGVVIATNPSVPSQKPVRLIYPTNVSFRGLRIIPGNDASWPIKNAYYSRYLGAKVLHRGAGVVFQLTASGTYTDPTL
jgi:hypothetical protein